MGDGFVSRPGSLTEDELVQIMQARPSWQRRKQAISIGIESAAGPLSHVEVVQRCKGFRYLSANRGEHSCRFWIANLFTLKTLQARESTKQEREGLRHLTFPRPLLVKRSLVPNEART
jgi:hypothetical protein